MPGFMWQQSTEIFRYETQSRRIYSGIDGIVQNPGVGCACNQRYVSFGYAIE
jgi:hypothetical protein